MFDIATRPMPADISAATGVWFDWRLGQPGPVQSFPWTDFSDPSGEPQVYVDQLEVLCMELEPTLQTLVIQSIFTDARAEADDVLPPGVTDRRGWVGDEFVDAGGALGSRLWLYYFTKTTDNVLGNARFAVWESLQWMVAAGLAERVDVEADWRGDVLTLQTLIYQGGNPSPVYNVIWAVSVRRGAAK